MSTASSTSTTAKVSKPTPLSLDENLLAACVSCGLCLPHCPTYRVTEEESASPRGRITLMRAVENGEIPIDDSFATYMERCVQCRGCETACPSGVQFGALIEQTRTVLAETRPAARSRFFRAMLWPLGHHRLLLGGSSLLGALQKAKLLPASVAARVGLPRRVPIRRKPLVSDRGAVDAWLFTGCVMDAWQREVHAATLRVMRASGATVGLPGPSGDCCGALHAHSGFHGDARRLAERVMRTCPGFAPIVVNSAGCGAALKHYGELLGTHEAHEFSERVLDAHEWLAARLDRLPSAPMRFPGLVAVQDPCHLRHVQKAHMAVRTVLRPYADLVEIPDDGRCCGAGGSYQVHQPELARMIRSDKLASIGVTKATVVASANPGCSLWLAGDGLDLRHPMQIIDAVLHGDSAQNGEQRRSKRTTEVADE